MADDLSQLDELIEQDVLEALGQSIPEISDEVLVEENSEDASVELPVEEMVEGLETEDPLQLDPLETQEAANEDELSQEDIANDIGDIDVPELAIDEEIEETVDFPTETEIEKSASQIDISSSDIDSLSSILGELLKNKTIEITIKVKD